jgi:rRNA pseudouridine-1189 N-methylase Emg1 (Nep1/Mra1 family)
MANTVVLHPKGDPGLVPDDKTNYIIGGFSEGDFRSDLGSLKKFSIYDKEITVPAALELLHFRLFNL